MLPSSRASTTSRSSRYSYGASISTNNTINTNTSSKRRSTSNYVGEYHEEDLDSMFNLRQSRRSTFSFDRILYHDKHVDVTPSVITVKRDTYDLDNVHHVQLAVEAKKRWFRYRLRRAPPNLYLYLNNGSVRRVRAENPEQLRSAIHEARSITY